MRVFIDHEGGTCDFRTRGLMVGRLSFYFSAKDKKREKPFWPLLGLQLTVGATDFAASGFPSHGIP